ncbi:hypothetical protein KIW84_044415 [Lathyrus oleraceus]|uniref:Uncharacterized protein n=1 Tax=Pisum sativum TaxID=3888 RepID=A0A9D5ASY8_PEA|nr:hypothetical protein KIW84_044415 [Pisum sativum]
MLNHDKKKPVTKPSNLDQIYDLKTAQTTTASPSIATHKSAHAQAKSRRGFGGLRGLWSFVTLEVLNFMFESCDSDEDDDVFYYRYCASSSTPNTTTGTTSSNQPQSKPNNKGSSIGGTGEPLAPSKSTLYVSNLDYSPTNSDLHTLFSTFGRIARVTVLKDRHTRLSRGVAFVQFISRNDAKRAVAEMNKKILNGRTLTASIAADNGRAPEFIRKRVYNTETALCYECGGHGHLSYECPKNQLEPRPRPQPKKLRRGFSGLRDRDGEEEGDEEEEEGGQIAAEQFDDNWASVVDDEAGERLLGRNRNDDEGLDNNKTKKKGKKAGYFSDESDHDDDD